MNLNEAKNHVIFDLSDAQAKLNALNGSGDNIFSANQWSFYTNKKGTITVDFDELNIFQSRYPRWLETLSLDLITTSKLMWLDSVTGSLGGYLTKLRGIALFWAGLAEAGSNQLTPKNINDFLRFYLMNRWNKGEFMRTIKITSSVNFRAMFTFDHWKHALARIKINSLIQSITNTSVKKALTEIIPQLTDEELTYRDWSEGGTYNTLTLDFGQYYAEHNLQFFEKNIGLATAIASTFRSIPDFAKTINRHEDTVRVLTLQFLEGKSCEQIHSDLVAQNALHSEKMLKELYAIVSDHFLTVRREATFLSMMISESTIKFLLERLGIDATYENIDRFKFIVWNWFKYADEEETTRLLESTQPDTTFLTFTLVIDLIKMVIDRRPSNIPSAEEYMSLGLKSFSVRDTNNRYPRQLVRLVESAGLTTLVAITGWRKSEFGFPITQLKSFPNADKLDQYTCPLRYQVEWSVFKTGGDVLEKREITFNAGVLIERIHTLTGADGHEPCLFRINSDREDLHNSAAPVSRAVVSLWSHYVHHYEQFKFLDDLASWKKFEDLLRVNPSGWNPKGWDSLSKEEIVELTRLTNIRSVDKWVKLKADPHLLEVKEKCMSELPILDFYFTSVSTVDKANWVLRYRNRTLRSDWIELLDNSLPEETKSWIMEMSDEQCQSSGTSKLITSELVENCLYPSAHGFRHMWVEGVYRRYGGDVGWFVRSQFKHITKSQWLAYVRNKDNQGMHRISKLRVVSSVVHNYFQRKGNGYAGQLNTWLRRLFKKTVLLAPQEQQQFIEKIALVEISDIKANPWGYCLLKRRTAARARCAQSGEPQRHNASPDLCLGCMHNLMQSKNVEWILSHIQTHVDSVNNPMVPTFFKESSYALIKNAVKHIRTINSKHKALSELEDILARAKGEPA